MHIDQAAYVALYKAICAYPGEALFRDIVAPWITEHDGERQWLVKFRRELATGVNVDRPPAALPVEASWRLYALSRVLDLLHLSCTPPDRTGQGWRLARIGRDDHARFLSALGLEAVTRRAFHPFFHEIVDVDPAPDRSAPVSIVDELWPAIRLGPLLIARAGCRVRAGRAHLAPEIATSSTLYWAHARNNRPTADLSDGWGANSQWRTGFRQDYEIEGQVFYNVAADPEEQAGADDGELTAEERSELLRHRCFVRCAKPHDDLWPYDLTGTDRLD